MSGSEGVWVGFALSATSFGGGIVSEISGSQCRGWRDAGCLEGSWRDMRF